MRNERPWVNRLVGSQQISPNRAKNGPKWTLKWTKNGWNKWKRGVFLTKNTFFGAIFFWRNSRYPSPLNRNWKWIGKSAIIWKNPNSFEIIRKIGSHLENQDSLKSIRKIGSHLEKSGQFWNHPENRQSSGKSGQFWKHLENWQSSGKIWTVLKSSGKLAVTWNIRTVLKSSGKLAVIWKNPDSFEIIRKIGNHLEKSGSFWRYWDSLKGFFIYTRKNFPDAHKLSG